MPNTVRPTVVAETHPLAALRSALDVLDAAPDASTVHRAITEGATLLPGTACALLVLDDDRRPAAAISQTPECDRLAEGWFEEAMELARKARQMRRVVVTETLAAAPLALAGDGKGALAIARADTAPAFAGDDLTALSVYCSHAAVVLENARLKAEHLRLRQEADDLVSVVAHDFKTPLTSIKGFAQLIARRLGQGADERLLEALRTIDEQANRLAQLANDLTLYSRVRSGRIPMEKRPGDLAGFLRDCAAARPEVALNLPEALPVTAFDSKHLRLVVMNLLDNAVKCSPSGTVVRLSAQTSEDAVIVRVHDEGSGREIEGDVFAPFRRADRAAGQQDGSGLELAIAKSIVEAHGGRIWVESTPHQGNTFSFTLPIASSTS